MQGGSGNGWKQGKRKRYMRDKMKSMPCLITWLQTTNKNMTKGNGGMRGWYLWGKMKRNGKYKTISVIRVLPCCYTSCITNKWLTHHIVQTNITGKHARRQVVYIWLVMIIIGPTQAVQATMSRDPKKALKCMCGHQKQGVESWDGVVIENRIQEFTKTR